MKCYIVFAALLAAVYAEAPLLEYGLPTLDAAPYIAPAPLLAKTPSAPYPAAIAVVKEGPYPAPHSEYGVPVVPAPAPIIPVVTEYKYELPPTPVKPVLEYGVPKSGPYPAPLPVGPYPAPQPIIREEPVFVPAPVLEYGVPKSGPYPAPVLVSPPEPVTFSYNYEMPEYVAPPPPTPVYGVPKVGPYPAPAPVYGLPVPPPAPITFSYKYEIPEYVPPAPAPVYGVPKIGPYPAPHIEIPTPVYEAPKIIAPAPVYGPPVAAPVIPVISEYKYEIPPTPIKPVLEYGVPKLGPYPAPLPVGPYPAPVRVPHSIYGVPQ